MGNEEGAPLLPFSPGSNTGRAVGRASRQTAARGVRLLLDDEVDLMAEGIDGGMVPRRRRRRLPPPPKPPAAKVPCRQSPPPSKSPAAKASRRQSRQSLQSPSR